MMMHGFTELQAQILVRRDVFEYPTSDEQPWWMQSIDSNSNSNLGSVGKLFPLAILTAGVCRFIRWARNLEGFGNG